MKIKILFFLLLLVSGITNASYLYTGKIKSIYMGPAVGGKVFIQTDSAPSGTTECDNNTDFDFVFDSSSAEGKTHLSAVLIAYSAQKTVRLKSSDTCSVYGGSYGAPDLIEIWLQ